MCMHMSVCVRETETETERHEERETVVSPVPYLKHIIDLLVITECSLIWLCLHNADRLVETFTQISPST